MPKMPEFYIGPNNCPNNIFPEFPSYLDSHHSAVCWSMLFFRCLRIHRRFAGTSITAAAAVSIYRRLSSSCLLTRKQSADVASVARRPMRRSIDRNTRSILTYCRMFVAQKICLVTTLKLLFSCRYHNHQSVDKQHHLRGLKVLLYQTRKSACRAPTSVRLTQRSFCDVDRPTTVRLPASTAGGQMRTMLRTNKPTC